MLHLSSGELIVCFYNRERDSLLLGTICVFELQILRFVVKGLIVLRILSSVSANLFTKYTDRRRLRTGTTHLGYMI